MRIYLRINYKARTLSLFKKQTKEGILRLELVYFSGIRVVNLEKSLEFRAKLFRPEGAPKRKTGSGGGPSGCCLRTASSSNTLSLTVSGGLGFQCSIHDG